MKLNTKTSINLVAATLLVSVLPGCGFIQFFKDKFSGNKSASSFTSSEYTMDQNAGPVVMYIDGKPALSKNEFDERLNRFVASQFQGAVSPETLPPSFKKIIANRVIEQEVVLAWEKKHNAEANPEFVKAYEELSKMLRAQLLYHEFEKEILNSVHLTDSEVKGDYEKNKDKYVKANGGVLAYGVRFEKDDVAQAFMNKVKDKKDQFEELAKQEKDGLFKSFGRLSASTVNRDIPQAVKDAAANYKGSYPTTLVVREGNYVWDVYLADNKETEFYAFDDIKSQIESMLRNQKAQEVYTKKIEEIKEKLGVKVNEDVLGINQATAMAEGAPETDPSLQVAMDQDDADGLEDNAAPVVA